MASRLGYRAVFSDTTVTYFVSLPRRRQRRLLDCAHELAGDPFLVPDFISSDETGRAISHLVVRGYLIDFWIDHATKRVMIVEIEDAE